MAEHQANISKLIRSIFQSRIAGLSPEAAYKYRRTLADLDSFLSLRSMTLRDLCPAAIADYTVELQRQGLSAATVVQRLNILNSLLKAAADKEALPPMSTPREIARALESGSVHLPPLLRPHTFDRVIASQRATASEEHPSDIYADMLLLAVLQRGAPLAGMATLTREDTARYQGLAAKIVRRNAESRRKFIFDLKQSYQTQRQIAAEADLRLREKFPAIAGFESEMNNGPGESCKTIRDQRKSSRKTSSLFDALSASLWTAYAMRGGATASEAAASIAPANTARPIYTIPLLLTSGESATDRTATASAADETIAKWQQSAEALLGLKLPGWYAMRLRRGVSFDDFRRLLHERLTDVPELFYPVETIRKRLGEKTKIIEHPFISGTVFFRTSPENILPMFARIGDKAWCIRLSDSTDAPYARIPQTEMQRFQRAIGRFTADTELHPLGSLIPRPGEKVILIHTGYEGRPAEVEEIVESREDTAIIRVRLTTDFGYEWRINIDARRTEPLR